MLTSPSPSNIDHLVSLYRSRDLVLTKTYAENLIRHYPEAPFVWKVLGVVSKELGDLNKASLALQKCIDLAPNDAEAHNNIGVVLTDLGQLNEANTSFSKAILLRPEYAEAYSNLGNVLRMLGSLIEAERSCTAAIRFQPGLAEAHNNLGNVLRDMGRTTDAELSYRKAIELQPNYAEPYNNLGNVLGAMGRLSEAHYLYLQAIELNPNLPDSHCNLGVIQNKLGKTVEAELSFRNAIQLAPDYPEPYCNLGVLLKETGRFSEAEASYREAIRINPDYAEAHSNIGNLLNEIRNHVEAEKSCRTAIGLKPEFSEAYNNLGNVLHDMGRLVEAESCYAEALRLKPDLADAHLNLGMTLQEFCYFKEAESRYRESIRLRPNFIKAYDNFLFMVNYDENREIDDIYLEYKKYSKFVQDLGLKKYSHISKRRYQDGRIRIGYVSPDFKGHACRFFMEPLFRSHDKKRFKLYAYSNVSVPDIHTQRLKKYFDVWCDIFSMTDQAVAQRIYDDGIDVLIDLAGHTRGNRLTVFSMKPAPIQVTYPIGTGYTSGLTEIDYFLGDEFLVPEGSDRYFSESIFRLSNPIFCYEHPSDVFFETNDLPFLKNGYITFGSLSRTIRINDKLLSVWKEIISRVPNSRLRLDQKIFSDQSVREEFLNRFDRLGMPIERVELVSSHPHWLSYHEIDVVLDCFPHNAGTTTFESLWMGVPVLTKLDRPSVGRLGASILASLGLNEWIAKDDTDYINKAVHFSSNTEILSALRSSLRSMLEVSELSAPDTITKKLESAYLSIFDKHYPNTDV
jgi:protein O-GlcNAc transferase